MEPDLNHNRDVDYEAPLTAEQIARGAHRRRVGSQWEELGQLQLDFLRRQGLEPRHVLLDVGCGALRAGRRFVEYLDPGHYHGIDINPTLLDAGYDIELAEHLRHRLPRANLRATDRFDCDFGVPFDFALANSVFTHLSLNHIRLCLYRVAPGMRVGGRFFATFFEAPKAHPLDASLRNGRRWTERNAFFYYRQDLRWAASFADWETRYIGDWDHPHGQRMMEFRRVEPEPERRGIVRTARRAARRAGRALGRS